MNMADITDMNQLKLAAARKAMNGLDVVKDAREILRLYSKCGFSLDDDRILPLVGIESETDDLDLSGIDQKLSAWIHENYNPVLAAAKSYVEEILQ